MNAKTHHTKSTHRTPREPRKGCRSILVKTTLQAGVLSFLLALSAQLPGYAQQIESYDSGAYSNIFQTNPPAVFYCAYGQGLNGTRGIQPLNVQYSLNYLQRGPFDLSAANATLEITTFFHVTRPTSAGLGFDTLQLGFAQNQTASSFISPGQTGAVSWWLYAKDTVDTGAGFHFQTLVTVQCTTGPAVPVSVGEPRQFRF